MWHKGLLLIKKQTISLISSYHSLGARQDYYYSSMKTLEFIAAVFLWFSRAFVCVILKLNYLYPCLYAKWNELSLCSTSDKWYTSKYTPYSDIHYAGPKFLCVKLVWPDQSLCEAAMTRSKFLCVKLLWPDPSSREAAVTGSKFINVNLLWPDPSSCLRLLQPDRGFCVSDRCDITCL